HTGNAAHLGGKIGSHHVDVVGQVLPGAGHALDDRLAAELALGADLAGHARHLRGEGGELIDHRVDGVLQLEDLAPDVNRNLLAQAAGGSCGRDLGDVAHLPGQVGGHRVDVVGQVLPDAGDALDLRLAAELAFGADLAGDAGDLGGEGAELV